MNLSMNGKEFICHKCNGNVYRDVRYKLHEYECNCGEPLKYDLKDFMLDFKDQIKWHKDNCNILKADVIF